MTERHEKWVRVEAGTVIPAGQPWRKERKDNPQFANEGVYLSEDYRVLEGSFYEWFVDSSWKPPLVLPTEPTWGIAWHSGPIVKHGVVTRWHQHRETLQADEGYSWQVEDVANFIPLTDEQVARIEAAR